MTVRTRFAPSPTGHLHVGGARTALFNWLYARHHGGSFILRIEDTDRERSTEESVQAILDGLTWLDLAWDEGPYRQSERMDRYRAVVERLLAEGKAYHCYCSREELEAMRAEALAHKRKPRYDGRCRHRSGPPPEGVAPVVRFRNPDAGEVVVDDRIRGRVVFDNAELDDLVILRSDGTPTYHLTVVVDDMDMGITHVIRGDDHLNNTPRQVNLLRALGAEPPIYAHVPMILGPDGKRLSKRHGAVSVTEFREQGYLPEAMVNYLARLGWAHGDDEIFTRDALIELFDLDGVNRAAATFDPAKLTWLNQHYIKTLPVERIARELEPFLRRLGLDPAAGPPLAAVVEALRERAKTLLEMAEAARPFYAEPEGYDEKAARKHLGEEGRAALALAREALAALDDWSPAALHAALERLVEREGLKLGKVAQPLRVALTGRAASPPIDVTLALVGRERALARIDRALAGAGGSEHRRD